MDLSHITSQSLRRVLNLTERKDQLIALIAEIETEISKALSGAVAPVAKAPVKKAAPAKKARKRTSSPKAKSGGLKEKILAVLDGAGSGGLKVKDIAAKVGSPAANVSVWFSTTGKKLTQKLEPGRYAIKGAKQTPAAAPAPAAPVKAKVVVKARKKGKKPSPLKGRILALLGEAGPKGLRVKDIAAKLGLPGGNVSVWISTTGKNLVSKVEPGVYAVKGSKPAVAVAAKPATASPAKPAPVKKAAAKKPAKPAKKPAAPAKKAFKLKPKAKN